MGPTFKKVFRLVCFFLLLGDPVFSQELPFRIYREKHGLPSQIVHTFCQDSRGYLWIGTANGLSRFDGKTFDNYKEKDGLPDSRINAILEAPGGTLWVGTNKGCAGCSSPYEQPIHFTAWPELDGTSVYSLAKDNSGHVWLGTSRGLYRFDGESFRFFSTAGPLRTDNIFAIAVGAYGKLWLGTDEGIGCFENNRISNFSKKMGFPNYLSPALHCDSSGNLWIGSRKGLFHIDRDKHTVYTVKEGLSQNFVTAVTEDDAGNMWVGTWNGINLFSRGKFFCYNTSNGLPSNLIYSISRDREGNLWFATHGGVALLNSENIKTYTQKQGLPNELILDMLRDGKGRVWFGTPEGLSCFFNGTFKNYTTGAGLPNNAVNELMEDRRGNIWIGTARGLGVFSPASGLFTRYTKEDGLPSAVIFSLTESPDGGIWIGHRQGITRFRDGEFSAPHFNIEPGSVSNITATSRGALWFSANSTLYRYLKERLTSFSNRNGLPGVHINAVAINKKGRIWVGTERGLCSFRDGGFTLYPLQQGDLVDSGCRFILEDNRGLLWTGNTGGLACFDGKQFKIYTTERLGLSGRSWLSGVQDGAGALWFGSTQGVTSFFAPPVGANTVPPPIHIAGIKVMEEDVPLSETGHFGYIQNIFRFNFVGLSFTAPEMVQYKYRLEGVDKHWKVTKDRSLFYPFLPSGSYKLQVKAINSDGVESAKPAEYAFRIRPPYWRIWWFRVLLGLLGCSFILFLVRWRGKRVREKAELENKNQQLVTMQRMELMGNLAAGTVHDLKNLISVILGYSEIMKQKYDSDKEDSRNLEIIRETAATAEKMARQILSFAGAQNKPHHETVELRQVLTDMLDTLEINKPGNIEILWDPQAEPVKYAIHPARFQQMVMNLCINAFQAIPDGGRVKITLSAERDRAVILEVADSGTTGVKKEDLENIFEPLFTTKEQEGGTGLGLFVVKRIVDEYQGEIEVRSDPGRGTTFTIRFPLNGNKI